MFSRYESSEIYRSDDGGERWTQSPVSVRFSEVTVRPGANPAKRALMMSRELTRCELCPDCWALTAGPLL